MLRNLNETLADGRRVMGSPFVGLTGAEILAATSTGAAGPGCLFNDSLDTSARYRLLLGSSTFGTALTLYPNGSGFASIDGTAVYRLFENNVEVVSSAGSRTILVSSTSAPQITQQPQSINRDEGGTAIFTILATGTSPISYQWMRGGVDIVGATATSYGISTVTLADSNAQFTCRVENPIGTVVSQAAVLTVNDLPEPTEYPLDLREWPPGRVIRPTRGMFTAWPLDISDVDFFAFDFSSLLNGAVIEDVQFTVTPFYPLTQVDSDAYFSGPYENHGKFIVQKIQSAGTLGRHVIKCAATTASGRTVTLAFTLFILRKGLGYIR